MLIEYIFNMIQEDLFDYSNLPSDFMGYDLSILLTYIVFGLILYALVVIIKWFFSLWRFRA